MLAKEFFRVMNWKENITRQVDSKLVVMRFDVIRNGRICHK